MNKSLSQQICEICGIKPYYGLKIYDKYLNERIITNKYKHNLITELYNLGITDNDFQFIEQKYLPDFQYNKNNFIKLFELKIITPRGNEYTVAEMLNGVKPYFTNRESFLISLLNCFKMWKTMGSYIKNAIQEEIWEI